MSPRHTSRGIVIHEDQILLMERWRDGRHYFSVPGGGIEPGEEAMETVVREIQEETSCVVQPLRLLYALTVNDSTHHIYLCDYISGTPHLPADSEEAIRGHDNNRFAPGWFPVAELANLPFTVWKPIQQQLLLDLADGFAKTVRSLDVDVLP